MANSDFFSDYDDSLHDQRASSAMQFPCNVTNSGVTEALVAKVTLEHSKHILWMKSYRGKEYLFCELCSAWCYQIGNLLEPKHLQKLLAYREEMLEWADCENATMRQCGIWSIESLQKNIEWRNRVQPDNYNKGEGEPHPAWETWDLKGRKGDAAPNPRASASSADNRSRSDQLGPPGIAF